MFAGAEQLCEAPELTPTGSQCFSLVHLAVQATTAPFSRTYQSTLCAFARLFVLLVRPQVVPAQAEGHARGAGAKGHRGQDATSAGLHMEAALVSRKPSLG